MYYKFRMILFVIGIIFLLYLCGTAINQYRLMKQMADHPDWSTIQQYGYV